MPFLPTLGSVAPQAETTPERKPEGKLKNAYNPSTTDLLSKLRQTQELEYSPDTFAGKTEYKGLVVFNPYLDGQKPIPGDYPVKVRVYIPELYKHLPKPIEGTITCQQASLFPEFVAPSLEQVGLSEQPRLGQEVRVQFVDRFQTTHHYNNGFILGPTGKWGVNITTLRQTPLEKQAQENCKALEKKFRAIPLPQDKKVNDREGGPPTPGLVDPLSGQPVNPNNRDFPLPPDPTQRPKQPVRPVAGQNAKCDTKYVLEQLRAQFDFAVPTKTEVDKLKQKIWWHPKTAEAIAILHPTFRGQVMQMIENLASQSPPLYLIVAGQGGVRTLQQQRGVYAKGRIEPGTLIGYGKETQRVQDFEGRKCAIGAPGCHVSKATEGESSHNYALAIDVYEFKGSLPIIKGIKASSNRRQQKFSKYKGKWNEIATRKGVKNKDVLTPLYADINRACVAAGMKSGADFDDVRHCEIKNFNYRKALKKQLMQDFIPGTNYIKLD